MEENPIIAASRKRSLAIKCEAWQKSVPKVGFSWSGEIHSFYLPFILFICIICQIKRDKTFHLRNSKTSNGVW